MGLFSRKKEAVVPAPNTPAPTALSKPDFAALAAASATDPAGMGKLWKAVYDLDQWHFIARGSMPSPRPHAVELNGKGFLAAFTDSKLAHQWAVSQKASMDDGSYAVLSMPTAAASVYAARYLEAGVFGIVFDQTRGGFFAPLTNVLPMYWWERGTLPPSADPSLLARAFDFDAAVRAARSAPDKSRATAIARAIFGLESWVFLTSGEHPESPLPWHFGDELWLMAFTDDLQAARMSQVVEKSSMPGPFNLVHWRADHVPALLSELEKRDIKQVMINPCGEQIQLTMQQALSCFAEAAQGRVGPVRR